MGHLVHHNREYYFIKWFNLQKSASIFTQNFIFRIYPWFTKSVPIVIHNFCVRLIEYKPIRKKIMFRVNLLTLFH